MNWLNDKKKLLIGIGNSARQDDGLGWAFAEMVENERFFKGDCQYRFQLNLEDVALISGYEQVVFVDATKENLSEGYSLKPCPVISGHEFSTHIFLPQTLLFLCEELFENTPDAWLLAIQGYQWELQEGITNEAESNLAKAMNGLKTFFSSNSG